MNHESLDLELKFEADRGLLAGPFDYSTFKRMYALDQSSDSHAAATKEELLEKFSDHQTTNREQRQLLFENFNHLREKLDSLKTTGQHTNTNLIDFLFDYFKQTTVEGDANKKRYAFAATNLTPINQDSIEQSQGSVQPEFNANTLADHLYGMQSGAEKFLLDENGHCSFTGIFDADPEKNDRKAKLVVYFISRYHDLLKFLGSPGSQIARDHEAMGRFLAEENFLGWQVDLGGELTNLTQEDVDFIAGLVGDHENVGNKFFGNKAEGWINYIDSENPDERAKAIFFLLDSLTGAVIINENDEIEIVRDELFKRLENLYMRHVFKYKQVDDGLAIKDNTIETEHKIFNPEWGINSIQTIITSIKKLAQLKGQQLPQDFFLPLFEVISSGLAKSLQEFHQTLNDEINNQELSTQNQLNQENIDRIYNSQLKLIELVLIELDILDPAQQTELRQMVDSYKNQIADISFSQAQQNRLKLTEWINQLKNTQPELATQLESFAARSTQSEFRQIDFFLHQREVIEKLIAASNNLEQGQLETPEFAANLAGFIALQEGLGMIASQRGQNPTEVLTSIVQGAIDPKDRVLLSSLQKSAYVLSRLQNNQPAAINKVYSFNLSLEQDKQADWQQIIAASQALLELMGEMPSEISVAENL